MIRENTDIQAEEDFLESEGKAAKENPNMNGYQAVDFITKYCEEHTVLMGDFIDCKMNPFAFHALIKYRVIQKNNQLTLQDVESQLGIKLAL